MIDYLLKTLTRKLIAFHAKSSQHSMKPAYLLMIILIVFCPVLFAANDNDYIFGQAVGFYDQRNYGQALENFLELEEKGIEDPHLYYNIGNTYYRLGKTGKAILYYKRGLRFKPNDYQLQSNLNYVLSRTKDRQPIDELNPLIDNIFKVVNAFSINSWFVLTFLFLLPVIAMINLILIFYRGRDRTVPYFLLTVCLVLFLIVSGITYYRWNTYADNTEAVLIVSSANGHSGPDPDFTHIFTIHEGMVINVLNRDAEWSQVKLPTGIIGWLKNSAYERVRS